MFYGQCWKCGERWGLDTASTCKCPDEYPKQEPATLDVSGATGSSLIPANWNSCTPVKYTIPPHRKPLTDDEITDVVNGMTPDAGSYEHRLARAIEAAHGIKE